ncbi:MAG: PadR family transcriptional regulator [Cyclobacteriaceae bacterium]
MKKILGEFEEVVLLLVAAQHDKAYGFSIKTAIEEMGRSVNLSNVHTTLYRLEEKGLVSSVVGSASATRGGRRKRNFVITQAGKVAVKETKESRLRLWSSIPSFVMEGA